MIVKNILRFLRRFLRAQEAVSALEYAILVGVIVAGVGGALVAFSEDITAALTTIGTGVEEIEAPAIDLDGTAAP